MKRNPTPAEVEGLRPGDRVLVQLNGDRHETACEIAAPAPPDRLVAVGSYDRISHLIMRGQITALLD